MFKVNDLLVNVHRYKRTYQNYCAVFNINLAEYYLGESNSFSDSQIIHDELYHYFLRNKPFLNLFYRDWHEFKTIRQLTYETGISSERIIELFSEQKIFANRDLHGIATLLKSKSEIFNIDSKFRYYSRYQIIEKICKCELIERPKRLV